VCGAALGKPIAEKPFVLNRSVEQGVFAMPQGTIKRIVSDRGFGFISAASGDLFFHHSAVVDNKFNELHEGQTVSYEVAAGPDAHGRDKGPRAVSVQPA
jgi:CspA family cold shock protein